MFELFAVGRRRKPQVLSILEGNGILTEGLNLISSGAPWGKPAVFNVCDRAANPECFTVPGHQVSAHWNTPDPSAHGGSAAREALALSQAFWNLCN